MYFGKKTGVTFSERVGVDVEQRGPDGRVPVPLEAAADPHLRHSRPRQRESRTRSQRQGKDFNLQR